MASMMLDALLQGLATEPVGPVAVTGLRLDSRQICPGEVFIALRGATTDGHGYIEMAVARGAAAVVYEADADVTPPASSVPCVAVADLRHKVGVIAERFYGHPSRALIVVGVTGTNGKTSCCHFLAQMYQRVYGACGVIGTLGNGLWGDLQTATHTTPDPVCLHGLLREMADRQAMRVVMEVSSHGLEQGRVAGVDFDTAVLTNLSRDHLDYHGDMVAYGRAKRRLFEMPAVRAAVINCDDAFGRELLTTLPSGLSIVPYGFGDVPRSGKAWLTGRIVRVDRDGLALEVESAWGQGRLDTRLLGRFNAYNLLAVLATVLAEGMPFDTALAALCELTTVPGRMERFGRLDQPLVVVDYAHTPDALHQALLTLREVCEGRLWVVFGCGGNRDRGKRPLMGDIAARHADEVVLTDDNPRGENAAAIIDDIRAGMSNALAATVIADRAQAIAHAVGRAAANDVVLVAGKGHEDYQQVGNERRPFSDRQTVRSLLEAA